jgi:hypothetical protein
MTRGLQRWRILYFSSILSYVKPPVPTYRPKESLAVNQTLMQIDPILTSRKAEPPRNDVSSNPKYAESGCGQSQRSIAAVSVNAFMTPETQYNPVPGLEPQSAVRRQTRPTHPDHREG